MLVDGMYYEFTVTDVEIGQGRLGYPFIRYTLVAETGDVVSDFVVTKFAHVFPVGVANRFKFYKIPVDKNELTINDLRHIIGKKDRLKVRKENYEGRIFFRITIPYQDEPLPTITPAPKTYSHGEITVNHNSDRIRFEGPDIRLDERMPKSMQELENLIYQVIDMAKNTTYITLTRENEDSRQTIEEW